jgi:phosphohistidine phosphatase SixA
MKRRLVLALLASPHWVKAPAQNTQDLPSLLRAGAFVVMLRHAETNPGIGDPANFQLGDCSTQRNLSVAGRAQSRRIGQWFQSHQLHPRSVQSSAWCRCRDTAELAFGQHTVSAALNSTFDSQRQPEPLTKILRIQLMAVPTGTFEVWVTHQVNITALTGEFTAMGEALILHASGALLARANLS